MRSPVSRRFEACCGFVQVARRSMMAGSIGMIWRRISRIIQKLTFSARSALRAQRPCSPVFINAGVIRTKRAPMSDSARETVLIVKADESFAKCLEKILGGSGYAATIVKTAMDGIAEAKRNTPCLILVDRGTRNSIDQFLREPALR